jgi:transcriptional regulator with XRE-family HTH domain
MDMRRLVGRNFARIRREKGLTQEQMEERSGFSQQYISGLEQGRRNPTVVTLYELAEALGVTPLDLLQSEPDSRSRSSKKPEPK